MTSFEMHWILIAEDDNDIRMMLKNAILRKADAIGLNAHVVEATDGADALAKSGTREFNCIVTDLKMPKMQGDDMIKTIQSKALNSNTPMVVVSAFVDKDFKPFAEDYEHIKYLTKPISPESVAEAVLTEVRLGRRNERVPVHFINPFIRAAKKQFDPKNENKVEISASEVKKPDVLPPGDLHCLMTIGSGTTKANFCISFESSVLFREEKQPAPGEEFSLPPAQKPEVSATKLVHDLFDGALPKLKNTLGGNPHLVAMNVITRYTQNDVKRDEVLKSVGATVTITTHKGKISFTALSSGGGPKAAKRRTV